MPIIRYQQIGQFQQSLQIVDRLDVHQVSSYAFVSLFMGCSELQNTSLSSNVYTKFSASGIQHNEHTLSATITMFSKCSMLKAAEQVCKI